MSFHKDFLAATARGTREREKERGGKKKRARNPFPPPLPRRRENCREDRRGFTVFLSNSRSKVSARVWFVCVHTCAIIRRVSDKRERRGPGPTEAGTKKWMRRHCDSFPDCFCSPIPPHTSVSQFCSVLFSFFSPCMRLSTRLPFFLKAKPIRERRRAFDRCCFNKRNLKETRLGQEGDLKRNLTIL